MDIARLDTPFILEASSLAAGLLALTSSALFKARRLPPFPRMHRRTVSFDEGPRESEIAFST